MKKISILISLFFLLCGCMAKEEPAFPIEQDTGFMYERQQLNDDAAQDYDTLYEAIMEMKESVELISNDEEEIFDIYMAVLYDHPEIFWLIDRYDYESLDMELLGIHTNLKLKYILSQEEVASYQTQLDEISKSMLEGISQDASDYEKVKYVYDTIIDRTDYVLYAPESQNILSVMLYNESVCAGYARTMQFLLEKLGVDSSFVVGKTLDEGGNHAWNMVKMDGEYYYVDVTSGDQIKEDSERDNKTYAYLGMTSDEMLSLYEPESPYEISSATSNNYFVKEGAYFEEIDYQRLYDLTINDEDRALTFKCSNADVYEQMKSYMLDQYKVFELLEHKGIFLETISYLEYHPVNVITFEY